MYSLDQTLVDLGKPPVGGDEGEARYVTNNPQGATTMAQIASGAKDGGPPKNVKADPA